LGRDKEAHAEAAEVLRINPNYKLSFLGEDYRKNEADVESTALRKAGLN
jgi:hypothetical protein